jgi:hypothetical protein
MQEMEFIVFLCLRSDFLFRIATDLREMTRCHVNSKTED